MYLSVSFYALTDLHIRTYILIQAHSIHIHTQTHAHAHTHTYSFTASYAHTFKHEHTIPIHAYYHIHSFLYFCIINLFIKYILPGGNDVA